LSHRKMNSDVDDHRTKRNPSFRPQVSLSTILLGTGVLAVWIAYFNARRETAQLQARMPGLRLIAAELRIDDPRKFAVIQRLPTKYDELIWDVYVPDPNLPGSNVGEWTQLCLALDDVPAEIARFGLLPPLESVLLTPGRHSIELTYERGEETAELIVLVDGEPKIEITRPRDWESGKGWSTSNPHIFGTSVSNALEKPLVMLCREFTPRDNVAGSSTQPNEPSQGIVLWVQRADGVTIGD
jgi:hypothetical protein